MLTRSCLIISKKYLSPSVNQKCLQLPKINYAPIHNSKVTSSLDQKTTGPSQNQLTDGRKSGRTKVQSIIELMRWHKPTGTILALAPSLWSVAIFTPETCMIPDLKTMTIFTAGAIAARGMGCTLNDLLDRKYDRLVERTKLRPIACGDISAKEGLIYLGIQSTIGLYILCLNNLLVIKLGLFSGLMISVYPLFKRFTYWPQIMLALTMNWGVIMGCAAIKGAITMQELQILLPVYLAANCWTLFYDTIYAHQDKADDVFIGVKSSALILGSSTKSFLHLMNQGMLMSLFMAGFLTESTMLYYFAIGAASIFNSSLITHLNLDNQEQCWKAFDKQKYVGIMILAGILASVFDKNRTSKLEKDNELHSYV